MGIRTGPQICLQHPHVSPHLPANPAQPYGTALRCTGPHPRDSPPAAAGPVGGRTPDPCLLARETQGCTLVSEALSVGRRPRAGTHLPEGETKAGGSRSRQEAWRRFQKAVGGNCMKTEGRGDGGREAGQGETPRPEGSWQEKWGEGALGCRGPLGPRFLLRVVGRDGRESAPQGQLPDSVPALLSLQVHLPFSCLASPLDLKVSGLQVASVPCLTPRTHRHSAETRPDTLSHQEAWPALRGACRSTVTRASHERRRQQRSEGGERTSPPRIAGLGRSCSF